MANQSTIKPLKKIITPVTVPAQPGRVRQLRNYLNFKTKLLAF